MMEFDLQGTQLFYQSLYFSEENRAGDAKGYSRPELSSTEEEDRDSYIAELTRQMAHSMLQDDEKQEQPRQIAGSPQSTLWSLSGSSRESPTGPSREPSPPPLTPSIGSSDQMNTNEEARIEGLFGKPTSLPSPMIGFQSKKSLIDNQIRAFQFQRLKQERALKQRQTEKHPASGGFNKGQQKKLRPYQGPCPTPWSTLQEQEQEQQCNYNNDNSNQQSGSGRQGVFHGGSGGKSRSGGTGVFLPRGITTPCESRKKTGCATILIPAKVVKALKVHFDKVGKVPSTFHSSGSTFQDDDLVLEADGSLSRQQSQCLSTKGNQQEISLPKEWTY